MNTNLTKILSLMFVALFASSCALAKNIQMEEIKPADSTIPAIFTQKYDVKTINETKEINSEQKTQKIKEVPMTEAKTSKKEEYTRGETSLNSPVKPEPKDLPQRKINSTENVGDNHYLPRAQTESGTIFDAIRMQQKMENKEN